MDIDTAITLTSAFCMLLFSFPMLLRRTDTLLSLSVVAAMSEAFIEVMVCLFSPLPMDLTQSRHTSVVSRILLETFMIEVADDLA